MPKLEIWVSLASLGLIIMFITLSISFVSFLIGDNSRGPTVVVEPQGVLIQVASISGAPGVILSGIAYGLVKSYGSKQAGIILCITGVILIGGMIQTLNLLPRIPPNFSLNGSLPVWYGFMAAGVGIVLVGLIMMKKPKQKRINLDDGLI